MSFRLWEICKDPDKRAVVSWLGGGAVVVAGGIWTAVTFYVEHKEGQEKNGAVIGLVQSRNERSLELEKELKDQKAQADELKIRFSSIDTKNPNAVGRMQEPQGQLLHIDEQVEAILSNPFEALNKLDDDIAEQTRRVGALQSSRLHAAAIDVETMKLKRLIDKRSQMFDILRQLIDRYNETAHGIIQSIGR